MCKTKRQKISPSNLQSTIGGKREPLGGDERLVVVDLCRLGLKDTKQVGRVDKDDSYKDYKLGDKDIHLGMDGTPPIEKAASLYFFSGEECSSSFFLEKRAKIYILFLMLLARRKKATLHVDLMGSIRT
jgi:hypothetical protein